ncbi:hypothetical protein CRE_03059 [Caenorhabditis remanei]|uniref:Uncharacterized protein n=1 Tax=Caenorhabditis remanei TaxID=31234 RepID=E3LWC6_CAERE|nr:hypothetical protein CRE_03059 [Caenorhabditis remanei]
MSSKIDPKKRLKDWEVIKAADMQLMRDDNLKNSMTSWVIKCFNSPTEYLAPSFKSVPEEYQKGRNLGYFLIDDVDIGALFVWEEMRQKEQLSWDENSVKDMSCLQRFTSKCLTYKHQKKMYLRVIPAFDPGDGVKGEGRVFVEDVIEVINILKTRYHLSEPETDDLTELTTSCSKGCIPTISLSSCKEILEKRNVDKKLVMFADDPIYLIGMQTSYKNGEYFKILSSGGIQLLSLSQSMMFLTQNCIIGVNWTKVSMEERLAILKEIFACTGFGKVIDCVQIFDSQVNFFQENFVQFSLMIKCVIEIKKQFKEVYKDQIKYQSYTFEDVFPENLLDFSFLQALATKFNFSDKIFKLKMAVIPVWMMRVQWIVAWFESIKDGTFKSCDEYGHAMIEAILVWVPMNCRFFIKSYLMSVFLGMERCKEHEAVMNDYFSRFRDGSDLVLQYRGQLPNMMDDEAENSKTEMRNQQSGSLENIVQHSQSEYLEIVGQTFELTEIANSQSKSEKDKEVIRALIDLSATPTKIPIESSEKIGSVIDQQPTTTNTHCLTNPLFIDTSHNEQKKDSAISPKLYRVNEAEIPESIRQIVESAMKDSSKKRQWKKITEANLHVLEKVKGNCHFISFEAKTLDGSVTLKPSYQVWTKNMHATSNCRYFLMDDNDLEVAEVLRKCVSQWKDDFARKMLESKFIWDGNTREVGLTQKHNIFIRVIQPAVVEDVGEEPRIFLDEAVEAVRLCRQTFQNDDFTPEEFVEYHKMYQRSEFDFPTIPITEFEKILDVFHIDDSPITLVDDPTQILGSAKMLMNATHFCIVASAGMQTFEVISSRLAVLFMVESLICGVNWNIVPMNQTRCVLEEIQLFAVLPKGHHVSYKRVVEKINEVRLKYPGIYEIEPYPDIFLRNMHSEEMVEVTHFQNIAVEYGLVNRIFMDPKLHVWKIRTLTITAWIENVLAEHYHPEIRQAVVDGMLHMVPHEKRVAARLKSGQALLISPPPPAVTQQEPSTSATPSPEKSPKKSSFKWYSVDAGKNIIESDGSEHMEEIDVGSGDSTGPGSDTDSTGTFDSGLSPNGTEGVGKTTEKDDDVEYHEYDIELSEKEDEFESDVTEETIRPEEPEIQESQVNAPDEEATDDVKKTSDAQSIVPPSSIDQTAIQQSQPIINDINKANENAPKQNAIKKRDPLRPLKTEEEQSMVQNYFQYVLKEKEREKRNKILLNSMRNKGDEKIPTLPGSLVQPSCPSLAKEITLPNLVRKKEVAKEEIDVKKEEKQKIPPPNQIVIEGLVIEAKEIDAKDNIAQLTYENSETEDILTKEEVAAAAAGEMKEVNHLNPILMEDRNLAEDLVQNCVENALAFHFSLNLQSILHNDVNNDVHNVPGQTTNPESSSSVRNTISPISSGLANSIKNLFKLLRSDVQEKEKIFLNQNQSTGDTGDTVVPSQSTSSSTLDLIDQLQDKMKELLKENRLQKIEIESQKQFLGVLIDALPPKKTE